MFAGPVRPRHGALLLLPALPLRLALLLLWALPLLLSLRLLLALLLLLALRLLLALLLLGLAGGWVCPAVDLLFTLLCRGPLCVGALGAERPSPALSRHSGFKWSFTLFFVQ
jgi:hypothetical protein